MQNESEHNKRSIQFDWNDAFMAIGFMAIGAGCWLIRPWLCLIVEGVLLLGFGLLLDILKARK